MSFKYYSHNGKLESIEKATIPLSNIEYAYGFGVYESLRVRKGIAFFTNQHINRLLHSASILGLTHQFSENSIAGYISDLLKKEQPDACNLKILLIGGKNSNDAELFITLLNPYFPDPNFYTEGIKTITYKYQRLFPNAKTLNMLGSYLAYRKAKENGCFDALLIDENSNITEGTRTNFFTMKGKTIYTQQKHKILEGITREIVLHIAKDLGYQIIEREVQLENLSDFDSAFLTSTGAKILPIKKIDNFELPEIPENLNNLVSKYDEFLKHSNGVLTF